MFRSNLRAVTALTLAVLSLSGTVASSAESSSVRDLKNNSCKDIMRLSGDDREVALALAHGYVLGKKGTTQYEIEVLAGITDRFIDYCLDHPAENALESFEKLAQ